jgi:hypothetical protein
MVCVAKQSQFLEAIKARNPIHVAKMAIGEIDGTAHALK